MKGIDSDGANELVDLLVFIHSSSAERGLIREGKGVGGLGCQKKEQIHGRGPFYRNKREGEGERERNGIRIVAREGLCTITKVGGLNTKIHADFVTTFRALRKVASFALCTFSWRLTML